MDGWKWVVIDVGVILDTSASHSEMFLDMFGAPPPYTPGCQENILRLGGVIGGSSKGVIEETINAPGGSTSNIT